MTSTPTEFPATIASARPQQLPPAILRKAVTFDQLEISRFNVRTNRKAQMTIEALGRSILALGLVNALKVHPLKGGKERYGVHAGGRRCRAIGALIKAGALPADWPIDVVVRDQLTEAQLLEESQAENMMRLDLEMYEIAQGVVRSHMAGDSLETIAERLGQEPRFTYRAYRLGMLAPPIFDALKAGTISQAQAEAYGATEQQTLQLAAFNALRLLSPLEQTPDRIRAWLKIGDAEAARLLRFVGQQTYLDAGGALELDLFDDPADAAPARALICHPDLLRQLADAALAGARDEIRRRAARPDLRFVPQPPQASFGGPDHFLNIPELAVVLGEETEITMPDGDVVGYIQIAASGDPKISFWWESTKAKYSTRKPVDTAAPAAKPRAIGAAVSQVAGFDARRAADAAIKQEEGITQEGVDVFRALRRSILRAALVGNARDGGTVGRDFLVWSQLRQMIAPNTPGNAIGVARLAPASAGPDSARGLIQAMPGNRLWMDAMRDMHLCPAFSSDDLVAAFQSYRDQAEDFKSLAATIAAGLAIERSLNYGDYSVPLHDALADMVGLATDEGLRDFWQPTVELLDLLGKEQRLAIAEPMVERVTFATWARLKGSEISRQVLQVVTGQHPATRASKAQAAANWVHPLLRFRGNESAVAADADDMLEAAE